MGSKPRIVAYISGGVLQGLYVSGDFPVSTKVVLVDEDNMEAEGKTREEMHEVFAEETRGLHQIF